MLSKDDLQVLPRREIQALAKEHGIKANMKTSLIISELLALEEASQTEPVAASDCAASVADVSTDEAHASSAETVKSPGCNEEQQALIETEQNFEDTTQNVEVDTHNDTLAESSVEACDDAIKSSASVSEDDDVDISSPVPTQPRRESITASTYKAASRIFREAESELRSARRSSIVPRVARVSSSAPRRGHSQVVQPSSARARMSTPRVPGGTPLHTRPTPASTKPRTAATKASAFDLAASLRRKPTWQMKLTKPEPRPVIGLKAAARENTFANAKARRRREAMQTYSNRGGGKRMPLAARVANQ